MNGYELMSESYKKMLNEGRINKETADRKIRIYDFLAACDNDDLCYMIDSGAFNDIVRAYLSYAVNNADIDDGSREKVLSQIRWVFDEHTAKDIVSI